jgi:hypothetical protein
MNEPIFRFFAKINLGGSIALHVVGAMMDKPIDPVELRGVSEVWFLIAILFWLLHHAVKIMRRRPGA